MTGPPAEFLKFLAAQRDDYRRGLPAKLAEIDALWQRVAAAGPDGSALDELERGAHSLAGSGATFGFGAVSAAAKVLELAVHRLAESGGVPTAAQRAELTAAIGTLRRSLPAEEGRPTKPEAPPPE
jgi:chemotaxis protein histidine kinase CheA